VEEMKKLLCIALFLSLFYCFADTCDIKQAKKNIKANYEDVESYYCLADYYFERRKYDKAYNEVLNAEFYSKEKYKANNYLGVILSYKNRKMKNDSIYYYNLAIKENPNYDKAYYNKAFEYFIWDNESCLKNINKAIELNPNEGGYYSLRAFCKYKDKSRLDDLTKAIELSKNNRSKAAVLLSRGDYYSENGPKELALKDYKEAEKLEKMFKKIVKNAIKLHQLENPN